MFAISYNDERIEHRVWRLKDRCFGNLEAKTCKINKFRYLSFV